MKNKVVWQYIVVGLLIPIVTTFIIPIMRYENYVELLHNFSRANFTLGNIFIELAFNIVFAGLLVGMVIYIIQNALDKHTLTSLLVGALVILASIFWLVTAGLFSVGVQIEINFALNTIAMAIYTVLFIYCFYQWVVGNKRSKVKNIEE